MQHGWRLCSRLCNKKSLLMIPHRACISPLAASYNRNSNPNCILDQNCYVFAKNNDLNSLDP